MSKKPVFVFEGIEGSGKTHHITYLSRYLKSKKISFFKLREPGGSLNSEKIRRIILNNKSNFNKTTDLLLYLSARSEQKLSENWAKTEQKLSKSWKKKLNKNLTKTEIKLRFGVKLELINLINDYILKDFKVDFTFVNIVSKKNMISRLKQRKSLNRYDKFNLNFYQKVQNGFLRLAKNNKKKYKIINSNLSKNDNQELIIETIKKFLWFILSQTIKLSFLD